MHLHKPDLHWIQTAILIPLLFLLCYTWMSESLVFNSLSGNAVLQLIIAIVVAGILVPVIEEVALRGLLQSFLMKKMNTILAMLLVVVIPTIIHFVLIVTKALPCYSVQEIILRICVVFIIQLTYGLIMLLSNNFINGMILHIIWNVLFLSGLITISASYSSTSLFSLIIIKDNLLLTGGTGYAAYSLVAGILFLLVSCVTIERRIRLNPTQKKAQPQEQSKDQQQEEQESQNQLQQEPQNQQRDELTKWREAHPSAGRKEVPHRS